MLSFLRSRRSRTSGLEPSFISRLTYAVGDIHARFDLLEKLIERIYEDSHDNVERPLIVFLGDYIDRGPDSKRVIDALIALRSAAWCDTEFLMGNHEQSLLKFIDDPANGAAWYAHGGSATLASYNVKIPDLRSSEAPLVGTSEAFGANIPESHLQFLRELKLIFKLDDYLFVHAGVRPGVALEDQDPNTFLWIRTPFLTAKKACDHVVVHGHTPSDQPSNERWRIGLDTGAYATGVLTAVKLTGIERKFINVR